MSDLTIVGLGITNVDQVTRETEAALRVCNEALFVDTGIATGPWLQTLCPRVTDLYREAYRESEGRSSAYHHMVARTLDAALDHAPVVFAMQGHPIVYAYAPSLLRDLGVRLGLSVRVLPGVSAMDCLFADLMVDPSVHGLQLYEATDLLLRQRPLQPDVPLLVWQVGNLETRLHTLRRSRPERLFRFQRYLERTYAADHPVVAYFAAPHPLMAATVLRFPLSELSSHAPALHAGVTLYLPPAHVRPVYDADLLAVLDDAAHLERVTC